MGRAGHPLQSNQTGDPPWEPNDDWGPIGWAPPKNGLGGHNFKPGAHHRDFCITVGQCWRVQETWKKKKRICFFKNAYVECVIRMLKICSVKTQRGL